MPEKTDTELFNDAVEFKKKANQAQDSIDQVKREINKHRNELDEFTKQKRIAIRKLEDELMDWQKVKRSNNTLADEAEQQAWATRRMG